MEPNVKLLLVYYGFYLVVGVMIHSVMYLVGFAFLARGKWAPYEVSLQERWIDGLRHAKMLGNVLVLVGGVSVTLLWAYGQDPRWSMLFGFAAALFVQWIDRFFIHLSDGD